MLNTVEKRRQLLAVVLILALMHLFLSEQIVSRNHVEDPELSREFGELFDEYKLMWSGL